MLRLAVVLLAAGLGQAQPYFGFDQCTCTKFQSNLKRGGSACQYGNNCASRLPENDFCQGSNGVPCCIDKSITCSCPDWEEGAEHGDAMCQMKNGKKCRLMKEGERKCPYKQRKCFLALPEYRDEVYCFDKEGAPLREVESAAGLQSVNLRMTALMMLVVVAAAGLFLAMRKLAAKPQLSAGEETKAPLMAG